MTKEQLQRKVEELENKVFSLEQDVEYWVDEANRLSDEIDKFDIDLQDFIDHLFRTGSDLYSSKLVDSINNFYWGKIKVHL